MLKCLIVLVLAFVCVTVSGASHTERKHRLRSLIQLSSQNAPAQAELVQLPKGLTEKKARSLQDDTDDVMHADPFDSPSGPQRPNSTLQNGSLKPTGKRVRKNILHMTARERNKFLSAINLLKQEKAHTPKGIDHDMDKGLTWNTWDYMAMMHTNISLNSDDVASGVTFLPWHRNWLLKYERELQRITGDDTMAIPYWDWSNRFEATKVFTDAIMGGNGSSSNPNGTVTNGPYGNWTQKVQYLSNNLSPGGITREIGIDSNDTEYFRGVSTGGHWVSSWGTKTTARTYGGSKTEQLDELSPEQKHSGTFPAGCDVLRGLNTDLFYTGADFCKPTFALAMSYLHIEVHRTVGGDMNKGAANDPLLLIHHAFVDKLWMMWQKSHYDDMEANQSEEKTVNHYGFPDGDLDTMLEWVGGTPRQMLSWQDLDYEYEGDDTIDEKWERFHNGGQDSGQCKGFFMQTGHRKFSMDCHNSP